MIEVIDEYHRAHFVEQGLAHFFIPALVKAQEEEKEEDKPEAKVVRGSRRAEPKATEGVETK